MSFRLLIIAKHWLRWSSFCTLADCRYFARISQPTERRTSTTRMRQFADPVQPKIAVPTQIKQELIARLRTKPPLMSCRRRPSASVHLPPGRIVQQVWMATRLRWRWEAGPVWELFADSFDGGRTRRPPTRSGAFKRLRFISSTGTTSLVVFVRCFSWVASRGSIICWFHCKFS